MKALWSRKINVNKTIIMAIFLNIILIGTIIGIIIRSRMYNMHSSINLVQDSRILLLIIILIACLNSLLFVKDFYVFLRQDLRYKDMRNTLEQVETLNNTLRAQRHDFMNHLQVIYSLMEMDEYKEASDYIERVFNDIQKVSSVLKTANPAVNALLQAKIMYGEKRGIRTELKITSRLKALKMPSWELCRVLGNIIDNGIYALQSVEGDRIIKIEIFEDLKVYGFRISDNGPRIPEKITDQIFNPGFTTKGDKGQGMGLAISKETLARYGGDIILNNEEGNVTFDGWVPK